MVEGDTEGYVNCSTVKYIGLGISIYDFSNWGTLKEEA